MGMLARLQSVNRPKGCESFVLFPRLLSKPPPTKQHVNFITTQRFGVPIECGNLKSCCSEMCKLIPILGPFGFCQQIACIAATMRVANVTHLDIKNKNFLYGKTSNGRAEIVLFDFNVARVYDWSPRLHLFGADKQLKQRPIESFLDYRSGWSYIGLMVYRLSRIASVGYQACSYQYSNMTNITIAHDEFGASVETKERSAFQCPFASALQKMIPE